MLTEEDIKLAKSAMSVLEILLSKSQIGRKIKLVLKAALSFLSLIVRKSLKAIQKAVKYVEKAAIAFDVDDKGIPHIIDDATGKIVEALEA